MAYKKYIKKNGKIYGPYIYHSKRVNGKVVSEYRGSKEKSIININKTSKRNLALVFAGVFLILFLSLFFIIRSGDISGNVILNLDSQYQENQSLEGVLSIGLKEGEMIPESSKIIFENANTFYEYDLNQFVSAESMNGDFFIEGEDSLGQGKGYGLIGNQVIYPDVYFQFQVVDLQVDLEDQVGLEESPEEVEEIVEPEIVELEVIEEEIPEGVEDPIVPEEVVEAIPEEPVEEFSEPVAQVDLEDQVGLEESPEKVEEIVDSEIVEPEVVEEIEEIPMEEVAEETVESEPSITGNIARGFLGTLSKVFVGITPTGKVVSTEGEIIQADISYGEELRYILADNQNIEIISGSVRTDIKELSVTNLQTFREGNEIIIKTDYYEETSGFGEEYIGNSVQNLEIDLSSLGLMFEDSALKIKLVYEGNEFKSFEVDLSESFIETENVSSEEEFVLSDQEKNILNNEFGEETVAQTARSYKDWIIVSFNLGEYEVEYSYNKDLSKEELDSLIVKDKLNWLKDISKELTTEETPSFKLDEFNTNYDLS